MEGLMATPRTCFIKELYGLFYHVFPLRPSFLLSIAGICKQNPTPIKKGSFILRLMIWFLEHTTSMPVSFPEQRPRLLRWSEKCTFQLKALWINVPRMTDEQITVFQKATEKRTNYNFKEWSLILAKNIPGQINSYDCGVYVMKYMEHILKPGVLVWNSCHDWAEKMPLFRAEIAYEIFRTFHVDDDV
ncbi:Ubiquitin-like-specific protease ESD4 [Platanthera zijinensis]|uniref:Ubiquitin-like-specific protease ESD4 n=1 Tax=Platanthera zijinensis TaxID=2320716 RepID=A0AAP0GFD2_9ASPA